jgi:tRNA nucleotidyltransferase/poly(A) polymerase
MQYRIPEEISVVSNGLRKAGYEAYLVGGCVRDLIIGLEPKDWDITTNAHPEQIQAVFPDSFYENDYGTVGVKTESENPRTAIVEVTPYRTESGYYSHPEVERFPTDDLLVATSLSMPLPLKILKDTS